MDSVIVVNSSDDEESNDGPENCALKTISKMKDITINISVKKSPIKLMKPILHSNSENSGYKKFQNSISKPIQIINSLKNSPITTSMPVIVDTRSLQKYPLKTMKSTNLSETAGKNILEKKLFKKISSKPNLTVTKKKQRVKTNKPCSMSISDPIQILSDDENIKDENKNDDNGAQIVENKNEILLVISDYSTEENSKEQSQCSSIENLNSPYSVNSSPEKENSMPSKRNLDINKENYDTSCKKMKFCDSENDDNNISISQINEDSQKTTNDKKLDFIASKSILDNTTSNVSTVFIENGDTINTNFKEFLQLYIELEKSTEMKEKYVRKLIQQYQAVVPEYMNSEDFCFHIDDLMSQMKKNPENSLLYIYECSNILKAHKLKSKAEKDNTENSNQSTDKSQSINEKIAKLEQFMIKLNKKIKKLEESDEEYAYHLVDKYQRKFLELYKKTCELKGECGVSQQNNNSRIILEIFRDEKQLLNIGELIKKKARKKMNWFPDFHEILKCVHQCAEENKLSLSDSLLYHKAQEFFIRIGNALQKQRKSKELVHFCGLLGNAADPADTDEQLTEALNKNRPIGVEKMDQVLKKFTDIEFESKLIAEEVSEENSKDSSPDSSDVENP